MFGLRRYKNEDLDALIPCFLEGRKLYSWVEEQVLLDYYDMVYVRDYAVDRFVIFAEHIVKDFAGYLDFWKS